METIIPAAALRFRAYKNLISNGDSYLYSTGWMESLKQWKACDQNGNPIPWMNYPVVNFLEERLTEQLTLFEYGSGYSTHFYAQRVKTVTSVEYDKKWFRTLMENLPGNVHLLYKEADIDGEYCRSIGSTGSLYDVVVVDGRDRVNCIRQGILSLTPAGVIILDDSGRSSYQEGILHAKGIGFRALHFEGLKPTGFGTDRTSILYRDMNCLGL
ncbi:MAG: hypothetical protein JXA03_13090 [Bacteroidales bacterium]|nr:hypothetical protein [Bacteroidales bacterium]